MNGKEIRKLFNEQCGNFHADVKDEEILKSKEFNSYLNALIFSLTGQECKLETVYDPSNKDVAYTNGSMIFLNTANELSSGYVTLNAKAACLAGIIAHECAHKLYLDFDGIQEAHKKMELGYIFEGISDNIPLTPDEQHWRRSLETAMQTPAFRNVLITIYHQLDNIVADAHDEASLCRDYNGIGVKGLQFSSDALRREMKPLEEMSDWEPLSIVTGLMLQVARYREIISLEKNTIDNSNEAQSVLTLSPFLDEARRTDDYKERAKLLNRCILHLWPYIEDIANQMKQQQQQQNGNGDGSGNSGNDSNSNGSSDGQDSSKGENGSNSGSGSPQPSSSQSSSSQSGSPMPLTPELAKKILEQIQKADQGGTAAPKGNNDQQPQKNRQRNAGNDSQNQGEPNQQGNTVNGGDPTSPNGQDSATNDKQQTEETMGKLMENIRKAIEQQKKQEYINDNAEAIISASLNTEINVASQTSPHKGRPLAMHREQNVTDADKRAYDAVYKTVKVYSQQMQRKIGAILADLREGGIDHHRAYGKIVEARDGYRPDGKFFAKKKLPKELPDMAVAVLLDQSGSMNGDRIKTAIKAAVLLDDFATGLGLPVMIAGHNTAGCSSGTSLYIHTMFDRVGNKDKYRIIKARSNGNNRDGMAINVMVDQLDRRPEDIKMLIIVSDGRPNGDCYGGKAAEDDIKEIVSRARTKGIQVFAAAIGDDKKNIERIYGEGFLDIADLSTLPKKMARLISKRII